MFGARKTAVLFSAALLVVVSCQDGQTPTAVSDHTAQLSQSSADGKALWEFEQPTYNEQSLLKSRLAFRWDIVDLPTIPGTTSAGGTAKAFAEDGSSITLTGSGTFEADDEPHDDVTGGGTWTTSSGSGTYEVTNFVSFHPELIGTAPFPPLTDGIGDPADALGGLVHLTIKYDDGSQGVLVVGCRFGNSPSEIMGGITVSKGNVNFWNRELAVPPANQSLTIFHSLPDHHHHHR